MKRAFETRIELSGKSGGRTRVVLLALTVMAALAVPLAIWGQTACTNNSNQYTNTCPAPTGLTVTGVGDTQVMLSWTAVSGASYYDVYVGTAPGQESSTPVTSSVTGTTYDATQLTNGTKYYFTVEASTVPGGGQGPASNEVSGTPAPATEGTNSAASFNIYPEVVAPNPMNIGFNNMSTNQNSRGSQIAWNDWINDGGFTPYDSRYSLTATQTGTATTFISQSGSGKCGSGTDDYCTFITGKFVGATAYTYRYDSNTKAWSLLRGPDTITGYTADGENPTVANSTITFANAGPAPESGDVIWLDMDNVQAVVGLQYLDARFTAFYPSWFTESQTSGKESRGQAYPATLSTDVPASDAGNTSMEVSDTVAETNGIWQFSNTNKGQFQAGHTYKVDVWLKQSGIADGTVTFTLKGGPNFNDVLATQAFTVTGTWQEFAYTFTAPSEVPATTRLDFTAPGTMWVDNFQIYDTSWPAYTPNAQLLQAWQSFQPGTIRTWIGYRGSDGGYGFPSLNAWLTQPEIKSRSQDHSGNGQEASGILEHLPDLLADAKAIGADPWITVNMSLSQTEWGELIDYLTAPAGTGYATMRPSDHPGPYTDDFNTIYIEFGNEQWSYQVPADVEYGAWAHMMLSQAIAGKNYFDPGKIKFVVNGFTAVPSYGTFGDAAAAAAPEASYVDYYLYSSGNANLTGDPYFQSDLLALLETPATNPDTQADMGRIDAIVSQQQADAANGLIYGLAAYEAGPGTDVANWPGDDTLAAAIGAIDTSLYASQSGFGPQNFFGFALGGPWSSHTTFSNGSNSFLPHPVWEAYQMRNNHCSGPMVLVSTDSVPTTQDGNNFPLIGVYTFQDANVINQADVVVISRDLINQTPVTLNFPATPTGNGTLYTLTGDPRLTNDDAMNIPIGTQSLSGVTKSYTFTMPPGSMYILQIPMTGTWSSSGEPTPAAPTGLSADANNGKVRLTWNPSEGASGYNVLRGTASGGPYSQIATTTVVAYTDTAVTNGIIYYYVVQATSSAGASANSAQVSATPNVIDVGQTGTPPPLNGSSGGAWTNAPEIPLAHHNLGSTPDTAWYKTLWDSNYLYVLVSVQDSTPIQPTTSSNIWQGDSVEVYFSGTDTTSSSYGPTDFQYAFPYGSGGAPVTESKHGATQGIIFAQENIVGGYQMTMAIPWTTLGTTPVANQQYGFDVMVNDATSVGTELGKLAWWSTANNTWSNPSLMGPLVLTGVSSTPPLAYEPFGEAEGALNGVSGSGDSGWGAAWFVQNNDTTVPGYNIAAATPLSYPGLQTSGGNYAIGGTAYLTAGRQLDVSAGGPFNSYLSSGLIGAPGQTIWISFLLRKDVNNTQSNYVVLNSSHIAWGGGTAHNIGIGYFGAASQSGGVNYWSLQNNGVTTLSNVPVTIGQTTLLVAEITFGSTNTVNLYINPTSLGGAAPAPPNATYSTTNSVAFQAISYYAGNSANQSSLDDIRVGTSYAAVTPSP